MYRFHWPEINRMAAPCEYRPRLRREIQPVTLGSDGILYRAITTTGHIDVNRPQGRPIVRVPAWCKPDEDGAGAHRAAIWDIQAQSDTSLELLRLEQRARERRLFR